MYLKRDRIIRKQIQINKQSNNWKPLPEYQLKKLEAKAHEQLSLNKILNREIDYSKIQLFLLLSNEEQKDSFYNKFKSDIIALFNNQKAQKTFQNRWTPSLKSNVMRCFSQIASNFYNAKTQNSIKAQLAPIYIDTIQKLLSQDKISRIEEKFLEPFLILSVRTNAQIQKILGPVGSQKIIKIGQQLAKDLSQRQAPKQILGNQFLKYCCFRFIGLSLPHEKYLYNQLLHSPNPKYLLPFRRRGTFIALTNQMLLKSNKLDMVSCQFWSYYEYQEGQLYEKIRRAAQWGGKVDILLILIKSKIQNGLEKYLNSINEKVIYFNSRPLTQEGFNSLMGLIETALSICKNKSKKQTLFQTALQKIDIGQIFQNQLILRQLRLRPFEINLFQLYLRLLISCPKKHLRMKFIPHLTLQLNKLLSHHQDSKFTEEMINIVIKLSLNLTHEERIQFLFGIVEAANHDWQEKQQLLISNEIILINVETVKLIAQFVAHFGFSDEGKTDYKILKLEFYYILALNYKENDYFQSKQKLSRTLLDINPTLSNNAIFNKLQTRKAAHDGFKKHLCTLYGDSINEIQRIQHQGLLAVIDEIITYRIQQIKLNIVKQNTNILSFYGMMTSLLEQVERLQSTGKLLGIVKNYFITCKKSYFLQISSLKGKDQSRSYAREVITRDVSFLIESCVSSNPIIADFSWQVLLQYIQKIPELAVYSHVLVVWSESISVLYRKHNQQYESKSQRLKGKWFVSGTPIPTEKKIILNRLGVLMKGLYEVIFRGHLIDDDYLGVRVQYLIRQKCKSASFGFGWKFLKHLTNSFKEDYQFISKQILTNNSCSWFVNQQYFTLRLKKVKPERILLDKYLIPLHEGNFSRDQLKKIFVTVEPQVETQFVTIPPIKSARQVQTVVQQLKLICQEIEIQQNSHHINEQRLQQKYSNLFDVVSRVKMIFITNQNQSIVFSQILDVCRKYINVRLLQHTLLKIVPFFYCLAQFNSKIVQTLAEMLHFIVNQLNTSCKMPIERYKTTNNLFDVKHSQFQPLVIYEQKQMKLPGNRHKIFSSHKRRINNLKLMYNDLMQFFKSHMHACIAKGFSLSLLLRVFSVNFLFQNKIIGQLPLEGVCNCLLSQLQLVNVLKSALEKGQINFDQSVVDNFYLKTLKNALIHFQKEAAPQIQLIAISLQLKSSKQKIDFLIQICDYLRNDDFHQLSKKKLPKRNELFAKKQNEIPILKILNESKNNKNKKQSKLNLNIVEEELNQQIDLTVLRYSLLYLIAEQIDRIISYAYPQLSTINNPYSLAGKKGFIRNQMLLQLFNFLKAENGSILLYNFVEIFGDRIQNPSLILDQIQKNITNKPIYIYTPFLKLFINENLNHPQKIREINYWRSPNIPVILQYFGKDYQNYPSLQRYVTKVLAQLQTEQILFYLPQIFQTLTLSSGGVISYFLLQYCRKSSCFAHQLVWLAKVQSKQQKDPHNKNPRLPGVDDHLNKLLRQAKIIIKNILLQFNRQQRAFFNQVDNFYEQVTAISGKMQPKMATIQKKDIIRQEIQKIKTPRSAYLPFNPTFQVMSINKQSGTPMQSAAKCPFLLTFNCLPYEGPDAYFKQRKIQKKTIIFDEQQWMLGDLPNQDIPKILNMKISGSKLKHMQNISSHFSRSQTSSHQHINSSTILQNNNHVKKKAEIQEISCIFKVFDDIRQDCLALQIIKLFMQIFQNHNLGLKLFPYHTLSNRTGINLDIGGIIEVVPNCVSRDSLGKTNEQSLYEFFINNFGAQHNYRFQQARQNFIRSQAAYSVLSYILQVKDRHNGNILVDKQQGYIVHIDFGFILDISPANNLKFQRAHFKLTEEMINIMGKSIDSEPFQLYLTLVIKGFLLARRYHSHVFNLVSLMAKSGLPCFLVNSLQNLRSRFLLNLSEIEAAQQMKQIVLNAADHWTTNWYDRIQWMQQKIYH